MKRIFSISALAAMAALAFAGTATAADIPLKAPPPPPAPTWTGTYIGINGGYGWGTSNHTIPATGITSGDFNMTGGLAGVTYGGNWQMGHAVLGFETDFDWFDVKGNVNNAACAPGCFTTNKWLSTERMRAGYDINGWLLYGTLGAAFARVNAGIATCPIVPILVCSERTRAGWTAGVGVETMFWRNWSAKLEYLHYDLGTAINYGGIVNVLDRGDLVRAGINYHFDMFAFLR